MFAMNSRRWRSSRLAPPVRCIRFGLSVQLAPLPSRRGSTEIDPQAKERKAQLPDRSLIRVLGGPSTTGERRNEYLHEHRQKGLKKHIQDKIDENHESSNSKEKQRNQPGNARLIAETATQSKFRIKAA